MGADRPGPVAPLGRRFGAALIDVAIVILAAAVPALLLAEVFTFDGLDKGPTVEIIDGDVALFLGSRVVVLAAWEAALTAAALAIAVLAVMVVAPGVRGRSPGKLAADLRVIRRDGRAPGVLRALGRTLVLPIDLMPGIPIVGLASIRLSGEGRRVGDFVAGTFVTPDVPGGTDPVAAAGTAVWEEAGLEPDPLAHADPEPASETIPEQSGEPQAAAAPEPGPEPADPPKPRWDPQRRTYVLWDPRRGQWLQYERDREAWGPLDGS